MKPFDFWSKINRAMRPKVTRDDWCPLTKSQEYGRAYVDHWGVFLQEVGDTESRLVDVSTHERDAELRACSLTTLRGACVFVREAIASRSPWGRPNGWHVRDFPVYPLDELDDPDYF